PLSTLSLRVALPISDEVEQAGVSGWVGAARSSGGALVDDDRVGFDGGEVAEDEAGLARSGDSGHSGHHAARDAGGDVLEVVGGGVVDADPAVGLTPCPGRAPVLAEPVPGGGAGLGEAVVVA